ncbi:MAG: hypothetical protein R3C20_05900 [Planctomycetaceae bacterium]
MSRRQRSGTTAISLFAFQDIITCVMGIMLLLTLMMSLQIAVAGVPQTSPEIQQLLDSMQAEADQLEQAVAESVASVQSQTDMLKSGALLDPKVLTDSVTAMQNEISTTEAELQRLNQLTIAAESELRQSQSEFQRRSAEVLHIGELKLENEILQQEIEKITSGQRVIYNAHDAQSANCWLVELTSPSDIKVAQIGQEQSFQSFPNVSELTRWIDTKSKLGDSFMLLVKPDSAPEFEFLTETMHESNSSFGFDLLPQQSFVLGQAGGEKP